eukprot:157165_1
MGNTKFILCHMMGCCCATSPTPVEETQQSQLTSDDEKNVDVAIQMQFNNQCQILKEKCKELEAQCETKCDEYLALKEKYKDGHNALKEKEVMIVLLSEQNEIIQNELNQIREEHSELQRKLSRTKRVTRSRERARSEQLELIYQKDYENLLVEFNEYKQQQDIRLRESIKQNERLKKNQIEMQRIYEGDYERLLNEFQEYKQKCPMDTEVVYSSD